MKQKTLFIYFFFILISLSAFSQENIVSGKVTDHETGKPLAFVNIVVNDSRKGVATDIDGKFRIYSKVPVKKLRLSYVGYEPLTLTVGDKTKNLLIKLKKTRIELTEVVIIAGENPAHRIIRNVIKNKDKNNPEKLHSFSYTSYDKMILTADTLNMPLPDTIETDTISGRLKNFLREKDLFIMETVTEKKFLYPDRSYEKVLASRISGLKDPLFVFLSSQLQSPSFYRDLISITDKKYINPISIGSLRKYYFQIEDTSYTEQNDTVFIISYRPRINTNFDGLKGVLSINSFGWAIQNVIAEPSRDESGVSIRIQQMYKLIDGEHWFPVQLNTDITFANVMVNNVSLVGKAKSYIKNIILNPELVKRQFNQISVDVDPKAGKRPEAFWYDYRGDSLSEREQKTYHFIDSIGKAENFDNAVRTLKTLLTNRIPFGYVDLDLSRIIRYNSYEGIYLGIGLLTSKILSDKFTIGGFWGYGFKDQTAKYGGSFDLKLIGSRELMLHLRYFDYATETGGVEFYGENESLLNTANFRYLLIKQMDRTERKRAGISFRAMRYANFYLGLTQDNKKPSNNYVYQKNPIESNTINPDSNFHFTEFSAGFRFAYKEKFIQMFDTRMSLGTKYPIIWFNYTRGISGFLDGEYNYNRFDIKINKSFYLKYFGESTFNILAGYIDADIPYTNLYNGRGSYRVFIIYAPSSFATMRMNEFLSDRYISVFYTHNFGKLLWRSKKFSPEFAVATNIGFGWLDNSNKHQNIKFDIMDKGYYESGLLINNIFGLVGLLNIGVGAFYRYGPYSFENVADNFAYKFTLQFPFK